MKSYQKFITEGYTPLHVAVKGEIFDASGEHETSIRFGFTGGSMLGIFKAIAQKTDTSDLKSPIVSLSSLEIKGTLDPFHSTNQIVSNSADRLVNFCIRSYSHKMKPEKEKLTAVFELDFSGYRDEHGNVSSDYDYSEADMNPYVSGKTAEEFASNAAKAISKASGHHGFTRMEIRNVSVLRPYAGYDMAEAIIKAMVASKCADLLL